MRALLLLATALPALTQGPRAPDPGPAAGASVILGRPTDRSVTVSLLMAQGGKAEIRWKSGPRTWVGDLAPGEPREVEVGSLAPATLHTGQVWFQPRGQDRFQAGAEIRVRTQPPAGSPFTFTVQGDSHPERPGKMYHAGLYERTLTQVAQSRSDFHVLLGDDFSIERLIQRQALSQPAVDAVYAHQRSFLGILGCPLFLVNGNHEQAARYLLDGTATNAAVLAAKARNRFYPLPAPDRFYRGDGETVPEVGPLRDYYAWTWGDALFVVLDPYWHSPVPVDNRGGEGPGKGGKRQRDLWQVTLGEAQVRWFKQVLSESKARWKFVFAHHVNGTGRGGVEEAGLYEWGGRDRRGEDRFAEKRPGWEGPIHGLMVKHRVTVFFQGHDHLYARQELDGVVYQTVPCPADSTYTAFNREAYRSGDVLPNSGHVRVSVNRDEVRVEYVRAFLPEDAGEGRTHGSIAHAYTLRSRK